MRISLERWSIGTIKHEDKRSGDLKEATKLEEKCAKLGVFSSLCVDGCRMEDSNAAIENWTGKIVMKEP